MSDVNQEFADAAVAAMQSNQEKVAPSADAGGTETAEVDPVLEYASKLKEMGLPPEAARDFTQKLAYMTTPQGQQKYFENFIASPEGASIKERFGMEFVANMLATDQAKLFEIAKNLGYERPAEVDDEMSPQERETKAIKAQVAALEARQKQLDAQAGSKIRELEGKLLGREEAETKRDAFVEWTKTQPPMAQKAYQAVAKRAHELATLYPDQYRGPQGFKKAAADAHGEFSSNAQYFQPKQRPRSTTSVGGGVAGNKVEGAQTLSQLIENMAGDFARDARDERGGE